MSQASHKKISSFIGSNTDECKRMLEMFTIFANETRFKILCVLHHGDVCVGDIVEIIGAKHSNVSQQLKLLTLGEYVSKERHGKSIVYHLRDELVRSSIDFFHSKIPK